MTDDADDQNGLSVNITGDDETEEKSGGIQFHSFRREPLI